MQSMNVSGSTPNEGAGPLGDGALGWIAGLLPGDHLCCLYQTEAEHRAVMTAFLRQGLECGDQVWYVIDAHSAQSILDYLGDDGLAVQPYLDSGQLAVLTAGDVYLRAGRFDPAVTIDLLRDAVEAALSEGYRALRVTGEMSWALREPPGAEDLIEYEALLNDFFLQASCLAICQYDRRRFAPEILLDVLTTHPLVVVGTELHDNLYYIPPQEFLGDDLPAATLDHWLENLAERKQVEADLARHRRHLESLVEERAAELLRLNEQFVQEEGALRESEARYRLLAENATDMISRHSLDGAYLYASPACRELLGYDPDELVGRDAYDLFHPRDVKAIRHTHDTILNTTGGAKVEYRLRRKDGAYVWVETTSKAVRDAESGALQEIVSITRDVAARKVAQAALQRRLTMEELIASLSARFINVRAECLDDEIQRAICVIGQVVGVDRIFVNLFAGPDLTIERSYDCSAPEVESMAGTVEGLSLDRFPWARDRLVQSELIVCEELEQLPAEAAVEKKLLHSAGVRSFIILPVIVHGQLCGCLGLHSMQSAYRWSQEDIALFRLLADILANVLQRQQAEKALKEAKARNQAIVAALPDIVFRLTRDGTYLDYRAPEQDLLAVSPDQFLGKNMCDLEALPAPLVARTLETIGRALDTGTLQTFEYSLQVPRGPGYFENRIVPSGEDEVINIIRDVTNRRLAEMRLEERTAQLEALREVGLTLIAQLDLDAVLRSIVSWAVRLVGASYGGFYLYQTETDRLHWMAGAGTDSMPVKSVLARGEGLSGMAWEAGQLLQVDDYRHWPARLSAPGGYPPGAVVAAPVYWRDEFLGVLDVMAEPPRTFSKADTNLLTMFTAQAAVSIANARLFRAVQEQREQLRTLTSRLAEVEEAERQRLARELHDQVGQNMTALGINLNIVAAQLPAEIVPVAGPRLQDSLLLIEQTTERIRNIMGDLRPPVLDDYGLLAALRWYAEQFTRRTGIPICLHDLGGPARLPARVENGLFRIAQEALTNVAKHAAAGQVEVSLAVDDGGARLDVVDDGAGFDLARVSAAQGRRGWGLLGMAERAEGLGGTCRVQSEPGQGTRVVVEVPL